MKGVAELRSHVNQRLIIEITLVNSDFSVIYEADRYLQPEAALHPVINKISTDCRQ